MPRPCPFAGCRHSLLLDVDDDGEVELAWHARESCSLDIADRVAKRGEPLAYYDLALASGRRKVTLMEETRTALERVRGLLDDDPDPENAGECTL